MSSILQGNKVYRVLLNNNTPNLRSCFKLITYSQIEPYRYCDSMDEVKEGKATVLFPKAVFYNPVQEFNRDLTVAVISQFVKDRQNEILLKNKTSQSVKVASDQEDCKVDVETASCTENKGRGDIVNSDVNSDLATEELEAGKVYENGVRILEGLAASGLRSMRFGLEIPGVREIIANDFDHFAVKVIGQNIEKNGLTGMVKANFGDAAMVMYQNRGAKDRFDVIDLDPYGSPHQFLDAAVQAVGNGGLLCITCTDAAVLCGNFGETCYSKYGSMSLRTRYCHEMALRIILQCVESHANRYSRYTVPVLSVSVDFYFRVFVRVFSGQGKVKRSASKVAMVYHCTGCGAFQLQNIGTIIPAKGNNIKYAPSQGPPVSKNCEHCGHTHHMGGPIWAVPIHDTDFVGRVIKHVEQNKDKFKTSDRILGMLTVIQEELPDQPLYYVTDDIYNTVHCTPLTMVQFRSALLNAGYRISLSHCAVNSVKTDAPAGVIWDIMREWVKDHPVSQRRLIEGTPVKALLSKEQGTKISFEVHPDANPPSREKGLLRYQPNPDKFWGPKPRAKRNMDTEEDVLTSASKKSKEV
ncbi:hypothetical protein FSP39_024964 [Pinctada imbricata]|uniref:tRNA (guanine(26)-N(2))-dimethyltransferase n=1 Tax=Pinctada imbricata TaxID=66713 RepID=A0AA88Y647_PINIB|nr:hypothetical protein FSP39_024964 [Pinctada imbricata]